MKREVNLPVHNEGIEVAVLGYVHIDRTRSARKISDGSGVSRSCVHGIV